MISRLFQMVMVLTFRAGERRIVSKLLSSLPLGRLAFRASMVVKRASLFWGSWSQRAIEYPWILKQLELLKPVAIVLDVGCAESLLSHELIARKYRVVGIDIREYPFKNKMMLFIKRNVLDTGLPSEIFDAVIVISTIEHIGLSAYGQLSLDEEGDTKAMKEFYRILKPGGIIIITTPYIGNGPFRMLPSERNARTRAYDREHLTKLVKDFQPLKEEYFHPTYVKRGKRLIWMKRNRELIDKESFPDAGLACLVLQKPNSIPYQD